VIAIKRGEKAKFVFMPGPDHIIEPIDVLVLIGQEGDILQLQDYRPAPGPEKSPVKNQQSV
jgi:K+/H+ antiporter YhaU regulatory subunit KhtT